MTKNKLKSKKTKVKKIKVLQRVGKLAWVSDFKKSQVIGGLDKVGISNIRGIEHDLKRDEIGTTQLLNENDINNIIKMEHITYDKKIYNNFKKNLNEQKKSQKYGGDPIVKVELKKQSQFLYDKLKDSIFKSDDELEQMKNIKSRAKNKAVNKNINVIPLSQFEQNLQKQTQRNIKKQYDIIKQQQDIEEILKLPVNMYDFNKQYRYGIMDDEFRKEREALIKPEEPKQKKASKKVSKKTMKSLLKEKDYNKVKLNNIEKSRLFKLKQDNRIEKIKREEIKDNERKKKQVMNELNEKLKQNKIKLKQEKKQEERILNELKLMKKEDKPKTKTTTKAKNTTTKAKTTPGNPSKSTAKPKAPPKAK